MRGGGLLQVERREYRLVGRPLCEQGEKRARREGRGESKGW